LSVNLLSNILCTAFGNSSVDALVVVAKAVIYNSAHFASLNLSFLLIEDYVNEAILVKALTISVD